MPSWQKSPPELIAKFDAALPVAPGVERRLMFGYPAGFMNGNMFTGLYQRFLVLRLADAARHEMLKLPGASVFEPMPGRPMREYVIASPIVVDDPAQLGRWMRRALDFVSSLPPKKPRKPKAPATPKAKPGPKPTKAAPRSRR